MQNIIIKGARSHNLKNVDVTIPRDKLIVITGLSGSGKSTLAFDTIFAEGQRRYVESLSAYARQFLTRMERPDVDHIEGLSPAIAIEQKTTSHNPRSTVGTITEVHDYLRLLYARAGTPICPIHKNSLEGKSASEIVEELYKQYEEDESIIILTPLVINRKGEHKNIIEDIKIKGFVRLRINNEIYNINEIPKIDPKKNNTIELVVDRLKIKKSSKIRLTESIETALNYKNDLVTIYCADKNSNKNYSSKFACPNCGYSINELEPRLFSFNSPVGACKECDGLGVNQFFDENKIINKELSLSDGAIKGWDKRNEFYYQIIASLSKHFNFDTNADYSSLSNKVKQIVLYGTGDQKIEFTYYNSSGKKIKKLQVFEGVLNNYERRYNNTESNFVREELNKYLSKQVCGECKGSRLCDHARNVLINNLNITDISIMPIEDCLIFFNKLKLSGKRKKIADRLISEIVSRLGFLNNVGLNYLSLDRSAETLSGGENQRIRLASQIGAGLVGVTYILDEPSIGLHQKDNDKLIETLYNLRDLGNTVIVVEHDECTIRAADHVIDIGPGAGIHGGMVIAEGTPKEVEATKNSITGEYLSGKRKINIPNKRVPPTSKKIEIYKASSNNLNNINVSIPIGLITCVTGVSGSGKSSLINETLYKYLSNKINKNSHTHGDVKNIIGWEEFDKIIEINQSPIGRTPRSNPATYTGLFTLIRDLFSATHESRSRGYNPGRFSFNVKGGRCESCHGDGVIKVEMHFLPDIYVQCDICKGKRYNNTTLEVLYKNKNITEVLGMTVEEAFLFFNSVPTIKRKLQTLVDVGLSYITVGQNATTLSGGEAQRVKLAKELSKKDTGKTIYIFDEPTTGLHIHDIDQLLRIMYKLRDKGNTIVIIEHNLDIIKTADWIIDMGPEGGNKGGRIIAKGTPEIVANNKKSYTGKYLKKIL
ncbi:MAG: excinuclease ABC subunit UvrA [Gammaproteobacteria bacterium]|jgi:excinuclease ABC subunit A|nr:excinuclease ABC subunit UvrA [Gammaproteobacteria bacterium]MBT7603547.1 excinuclease ABC subunit UvrA [Gammaproteobacteria bacterium]